ncbi:MAG: DUF1028 domain-containing protein [Phycisphaeraceae bacterium]|nr:MAG: DUF1028 domain-containing protein [Phycisphaeraceae bacterium]
MRQYPQRPTAPRATPALLLLAAAGSTASATWSILIADTRTGEIAVASATCVPNIDLREETPVLLLGRGAATAQSAVDSTGGNRARIFEGFAAGLTPDQIFAILEANDPGHQSRQYGMLDATGNTLTFSGTDDADWKGGVTGRIEAGEPGPADDIVYAVQGNILTGEPVVLAAEDAILNTPGDLAEKLMAAMEAADAMGGDGRCSCAVNDPTGCGVPPADFTNAADVGYMLIGRLGDRDVASSFLYADSPAAAVRVADLDGDGRDDLLVLPSFAGPITFGRNRTAHAGDPLSFASTPITPTIAQVAAEGTLDADGDHGLDVAAVTQSGGGVLILSNGDGTFANPIMTSLGVNVSAGVLGLFDAANGPGPEFAALVPATGELRTFGIDAAAGVTALASTPLGGTSPVDLAKTPGGVVVAFSDRTLVPLASNGDGTFTAGDAIAVQGIPINVMAGDLNGDGQTDYAYARTDRRVSFVLSGPGGFTETSTLLNAPIRDAVMTDLDGDSDPDVGVLMTNGRYRSAINDGAGGFTQLDQRRLLDGDVLSAADVSGDGLPELFTSSGRVLAVTVNAGDGPPLDERGFAGGDYFLELNVRNAPDPGYDDPVPQLRDEFDLWRAAHTGLPDSTNSYFTQAPDRVNVHGSDSGPYQIVMQLLDYEGHPATVVDASSFSIVAPPGRPVPLEVEGAFPTAADGVWVVSAVPTGATGQTELWVRINTDQGPVVIQPAPDLVAGVTMADGNADGLLDLSDIVDFLTAFLAGDLSADLTGNGVLDMEDVNLFVSEFLAG